MRDRVFVWCVCVREREREREGGSERDTEIERKRERERARKKMLKTFCYPDKYLSTDLSTQIFQLISTNSCKHRKYQQLNLLYFSHFAVLAF